MVVRSSTESEFRAVDQGLYELLWLKMILIELRETEREKVLKDERKDINLFKARIAQTLFALFKSYI